MDSPRCGCTPRRALIVIIVTTIIMIILIASLLISVGVSYPLHASCKIDWYIPSTCDNVRERLIHQFEEWSHDDCPQVSDTCPAMPCGQKCLYKYTSTEPDGKVLGTHATPVQRYIDNLEFKFESDSGNCKVNAFSSSDLWYAILDYGTNYCNLRNLLDGTGLSATAGFTETTSTSVCTQYDVINCERY